MLLTLNYYYCIMSQLDSNDNILTLFLTEIVTFFDWWEIQFNQVWSSLIHFGRIWSKKIKNKTAIFILFKNVTTLYTNIFLISAPIKKFFLQKDRQTDRQTDRRKPHRHHSSNSSLDRGKMIWQKKTNCALKLNSPTKITLNGH